MSLLCKNILLSHGETNFYSSSNRQVWNFLSKLLVKIKRSQGYAKELLQQEPDEIKDLWLQG